MKSTGKFLNVIVVTGCSVLVMRLVTHEFEKNAMGNGSHVGDSCFLLKRVTLL